MPKQAMILAAGKGSRLGALSLRTPKPLLKINNQCLIEYHLYALAAAGVQRVVINVAYMADKIIDALGDGSRYGLNIIYSREVIGALDTGGGILNALHHFHQRPFFLVSADIWSDFNYSTLHMPKGSLAHCLLVANPEYNPLGDMTLGNDGKLNLVAGNSHTYGNIAIIHPDLFHGFTTQKKFPFYKPLFAAIKQGKATGQAHEGAWFNIGTAKEIKRVKQHLCLEKVA